MLGRVDPLLINNECGQTKVGILEVSKIVLVRERVKFRILNRNVVTSNVTYSVLTVVNVVCFIINLSISDI